MARKVIIGLLSMLAAYTGWWLVTGRADAGLKTYLHPFTTPMYTDVLRPTCVEPVKTGATSLSVRAMSGSGGGVSATVTDRTADAIHVRAIQQRPPGNYTADGVMGPIAVHLDKPYRGEAVYAGHTKLPTCEPMPIIVEFDLYTHCGIYELTYDNKWYVRDGGRLDDNGNPPPGWGNPTQKGSLRIIKNRATFSDPQGHHEAFTLRPGATSPLNVCA